MMTHASVPILRYIAMHHDSRTSARATDHIATTGRHVYLPTIAPFTLPEVDQADYPVPATKPPDRAYFLAALAETYAVSTVLIPAQRHCNITMSVVEHEIQCQHMTYKNKTL